MDASGITVAESKVNGAIQSSWLLPRDHCLRNGFKAPIRLFFGMLNPKRATGVSGDTISSYEYDLTTIRRVAWFRRGTKRTDIPADFVARDNRLLRHSDHGTAEQQTLSCGKDGVRCRSTRHHRLGVGSRHQWISPVFSDARKWICARNTSSLARRHGVFFTRVRNFDQGKTSSSRARGRPAIQEHARKPRLGTRSRRRHASSRKNRGFFKNKNGTSRTQRRHQFHQTRQLSSEALYWFVLR